MEKAKEKVRVPRRLACLDPDHLKPQVRSPIERLLILHPIDLAGKQPTFVFSQSLTFMSPVKPIQHLVALRSHSHEPEIGTAVIDTPTADATDIGHD